MAAETFRASLSGQSLAEQAVGSRLADVEGARVVSTSPNPWRGGSSMFLQFNATARAGLSDPSTRSTCVRLDLPGRPYSDSDWHVVPACPPGSAGDPLAPELPDGSDQRVSRALPAGSTPDARAVAAALRSALPPGVHQQTSAGPAYDGPDGRRWGYSGGPVVTAVASGGADCLLVWVWRGGSLVWHPGLWDVCTTGPGELLRPGALPPDTRDAPVRRTAAQTP